jgi:hypothetical protein
MEQICIYQDEARKWRWRCVEAGATVDSDDCFDSCHACVDDAMEKGYLSEIIMGPRETPAS